MKRAIRVLVLNNYSLERVWAEVRRGDTPDHHLYGINHLADLGYEVQLVPASSSRVIRGLDCLIDNNRWPVQMGCLARQWTAWNRLNDADLIYAPCGDEVNTLAYLRGAGLLKTPIVSIQHHALNRGRLAWLREPWVDLLVRGTDAMPALSERAAQEINARCRTTAPRSEPIFWGPDAGFYPRTTEPGVGVLAAGRTARDFVTFGLGASRAQVPATIMCLPADKRPEFRGFSRCVQVRTPPPGQLFPYPEILQAHLKARVLAIPLHESRHNLAGLTSVVDALALGKPLIMTRNPYVDLDIEGLGIGRWVQPYDIQGWVDAIRWFDAHPDESREMGRRARALVDEQGYDSRNFARRVHEVFTRVLDQAAA